MLNDFLWHGFRWLPNIDGPAFIFFIARKLNELLPSLPSPILPIHIDDAHPLRTKNKNRKKVVIVRLNNRWIKDVILSCQNDLNGTGLLLTEHLTGFTRKLAADAASIVGNENTDIRKAKVYAKCNGTNFYIRTPKDIDALRIAYDSYPPIPSNETTHPNFISTPNREPLQGVRSRFDRGRGRGNQRGGRY